MAEQDTPPDSPLSPQEVEEEGDGEPAPPAAPGTAVVPLTKDAIEKFLRSVSRAHAAAHTGPAGLPWGPDGAQPCTRARRGGVWCNEPSPPRAPPCMVITHIHASSCCRLREVVFPWPMVAAG